MKITELFQSLFASNKPQELKDEDFVMVSDREPSKLSQSQQELLKRRTQELFQNNIVEEIEYSQAELASCGQINQAGKLKPFTNFSADSPHTYTSNIAQGEREATYHFRLASAVIKNFSNCVPGQDPLRSLQTQLQEGHKYRNRALQVAAVLKQIGDGLAPLPNNSDINMTLADLIGRVNFDPLQKGHIVFANLMAKEGTIQITISDTIDIEDEDGGAIASFAGSRVISVLEPDADGTVKCQVSRTYQVNDLNININ
ncbi:MAG: hypothetical protein KBA81_02230 [Rhabdochlamydiaceae bacterium]|nr:hypothetical protein [Rhabdochlamydiaceae bacterium]